MSSHSCHPFPGPRSDTQRAFYFISFPFPQAQEFIEAEISVMRADLWAARLPCEVADSQGAVHSSPSGSCLPLELPASGAAQHPCLLGCQPGSPSLRLSVSLSVPQHYLPAPEMCQLISPSHGCSCAWLMLLQKSETPSRAEQICSNLQMNP